MLGGSARTLMRLAAAPPTSSVSALLGAGAEEFVGAVPPVAAAPDYALIFATPESPEAKNRLTARPLTVCDSGGSILPRSARNTTVVPF